MGLWYSQGMVNFPCSWLQGKITFYAKGFTYVCDKSGKRAMGLWYPQGMVNLPCFWLQKKLHFMQELSYIFINEIVYIINNIKIFYIYNNQAILNINLKFKIKYFLIIIYDHENFILMLSNFKYLLS